MGDCWLRTDGDCWLRTDGDCWLRTDGDCWLRTDGDCWLRQYGDCWLRQYGEMKLYADTSARRHRQILADLGFVLWSLVWIWLATRLFDLVLLLGAPGEAIESAGTSLAENMNSAGEAINGLPVVGDTVRGPFDRMSDAGANIADAGRGQVEAVTRLAWFTAIMLAVGPIATLAVIWLPLRVRFVRRAAAAQRFVDSDDDLDLFALRALARQPLRVLAGIDPDPAGKWRRRDPAIVRALAELELRDEGLAPPRR